MSKRVVSDIDGVIASLKADMQAFVDGEEIKHDLSGKERRLLFSANVKTSGFIDKAFDIASDNPWFLTKNFPLDKLRSKEERLEQLRQLLLVLRQFEELALNAFTVQSDSCYRDALLIYGNLHEQSRLRVPGTEELYSALKDFFHKSPRVHSKPTQKELERNFKRLLKGKTGGKILVENEMPHETGGSHVVVDEVN